MICSNCNEDNPMGSTVCSRCGARLEARKCSRCGGEIRGKSRFCIHCGTSMSGDSPAPRPVSRKRHPSSSQQKQSQTPSYQTPRQSPPPQQGGFPPPQQGGYPPPQQGGYPPQQGGYPPQQGGYPPQQGNYPPQQGGYPPQQQGGYPPQQGGSQVSYSYPSPNDKDQQTLKSKTILLKEQFGAVIKKGNYREVLQDKNHPATQAFIDFIAWGITHFYGFAALVGAITFLGILLGGWGVVFGLALAFVYASYKKEIDEKVRDMKGQMSSGPSPSSISSSSQPSYRYATASTKDFYYQIHSNCTGCGACVPFCPANAIFQISEQFLIDQTRCNQCGNCEYQCPVRAIVRIRD